MQADARDKRDTAGVVLLPPLIYLGFLVLGVALGALVPVPLLGPAWRIPRFVAGGVLVLVGVAVAARAKRRFDAAGTATNPLRPTSALVAAGPYRFTRNPMYLGMALLYAGLAVAFDGPLALALLAVALLVIRTQVIAREERYLERKFGDEYLAYKARVRRWL